MDTRDQPSGWTYKHHGGVVMRIVIAEDGVLLRAGLVRLLAEAGEDVVAAVDDAPSLLDAVERHVPDLAIVDVRMPPDLTDDGLRAAVQIRCRWPQVGILVFSQYVEETYAAELLASGVDGIGYLLKDRVAEVEQFVETARRVAAGGTALDPEVVMQLMARSRRQDPLQQLSPREREVLSLMAQGQSNQAIADSLMVSVGAVEKHIANIFIKLDLPPSEHGNRRVLAVLQWLDK